MGPEPRRAGIRAHRDLQPPPRRRQAWVSVGRSWWLPAGARVELGCELLHTFPGIPRRRRRGLCGALGGRGPRPSSAASVGRGLRAGQARTSSTARGAAEPSLREPGIPVPAPALGSYGDFPSDVGKLETGPAPVPAPTRSGPAGAADAAERDLRRRSATRRGARQPR